MSIYFASQYGTAFVDVHAIRVGTSFHGGHKATVTVDISTVLWIIVCLARWCLIWLVQQRGYNFYTCNIYIPTVQLSSTIFVRLIYNN